MHNVYHTEDGGIGTNYETTTIDGKLTVVSLLYTVTDCNDNVMNDITENCLEAVADDDQLTESDEDCIAIAVEKYKKANP